MEFPPDNVKDTISDISRILKKEEWRISISEAACGGLMSSYLVSVAGASKYFDGSTLLYSLKSKLKLSGWMKNDITSYTGPSEKVAKRLARNLRMELGSTYVLSETGFAGPSSYCNNGATLDSKVGTVYFAVSGPKGERSIMKKTGLSDRSRNMQEFARLGLEFLLLVLQEDLQAEDI
ncbi:CinA family protein ASCRUDRAFT_29368 [Ascoidea rubescens DSM 1968]|uniref:CinA C-terminal domain-containing protein n=1 Tax=Ascoidea rubescens DSM 1968 TaxID=1344418 RepID=A0A1D2VR51_9ASCO|nr:hypothetical protein ASCRUDRAFT_29368 [Ascoidea rubescens DSM 1968]ODV64037.1 hypothetical protein ASCRUDRAFT_29368 [Ascoidea rubescens DSM 1968]